MLAENLLKGAASVCILATSREPLRAEGESVYRLASLEIPAVSGELTAGTALTYPAVELFVERVRASIGEFELSDSDAPIVADICRRLDGIALAIELAAGRVEAFGLLGLAARLEDRLSLLTQGRRTALPRHQTLAATLDWSYDALSDSEKATLRRLSVFRGGFTLDGAQAVAADASVAPSDISDLVASLVSKSLLNADVAAAIVRYRPLDMTREYALEKLAESGEFDQTARRHAGYIEGLLEGPAPMREHRHRRVVSHGFQRNRDSSMKRVRQSTGHFHPEATSKPALPYGCEHSPSGQVFPSMGSAAAMWRRRCSWETVLWGE